MVADDQVCIPPRTSRTAAAMPLAPRFPMLEPADSQECKDFTKLAYALSESLTPGGLRLTTRIAHSRSLVELQDRDERDLKPL